MRAIMRIEGFGMTLPIVGSNPRGVIAQEDFFNDIDTVSIFVNNNTSQYYYYDNTFNPVTDHVNLHHYRCQIEDCPYCTLVESAIRKHDIALDQIVSFATFHEKCGFEYDADSDEYWYNNLPEAYNMRASSYFWQEYSEDSEDSEEREYDYDNPSRENNYNDLADQYTYGYEPNQSDTSESWSSLRRINWKNLSYVGCGRYGITFSDGKYAIKVGTISSYDIAQIKRAASVGFGVPVYYFAQNRRIPNKLLFAIKNQDIMCYGDSAHWTDYVNSHTLRADISVMGLATPFAYQEDYYDNDRNEGAAVCAKLKDEYYNASGNQWLDEHMYNIGFYNDALVILDF